MSGGVPEDARQPARATLRDVAKAAGVSIATVSNSVNDRYGGGARITEGTRARIKEIAAELGYTAQASARGLRLQRTNDVSLVLGTPGSPWADIVVRDFVAVTQPRGMGVSIVVSGSWVDHLSRGVADGAFVEHRYGVTVGDVHRIARQGVALVVASNTIDPEGFDVLRQHEYEGCVEAMEYLVAQGHRSIACLRNEPGEEVVTTNDRWRAYRDVMESAALDMGDVVRFTRGDWERGYAEAFDLLAGAHRPTAIFALTGSAAVASQWAAHRLGLRVPDDVAIIGVDPIGRGGGEHPPITCVMPQGLTFEPCAQRMLDRIDRRVSGSIELEIDWGLVHRESA